MKVKWVFIGGSALCLVGFWLGLVTGPASPGAREVWLTIVGAIEPLQHLLNAPEPGDRAQAIIVGLRLPRSLLALLVGAGLGVAGGIMQALFRNPMAEPYLLGVSSGAGLGASVAFLFGLQISSFGLSSLPVLAFLGGAGVAAFIYILGSSGKGTSMTTLLLAGIAVGSFVTAVNASAAM